MHYSCVRQTGTDLGDTAIDGTIWLGPDGTNHSAASSHGLGLGLGLGFGLGLVLGLGLGIGLEFGLGHARGKGGFAFFQDFIIVHLSWTHTKEIHFDKYNLIFG